MSLRTYKPLAKSPGTVIPADLRLVVLTRDNGCVGPRLEMPGECFGRIELDHIRASHATGMKSETVAGNLISLCSTHHRVKTENGRTWRPRLLAYIAGVEMIPESEARALWGDR